ncbi:MAG: translocation and assembly module protein TamB [Alphaproteobacteria bacterium HGW-Alphaproteobacteria-6]|nr:MAG: translocation and assembly module protein TamB [Alphaproteobacteria bacterium HGW-Alphaproteobacteria-6]
MRAQLLALALCLSPLTGVAQDAAQTDADRGFLVGLIEDNLSGAGRSVRIDGFAGALSSRATFEQMTIADDDGVWLTIRQGAIGWNRAALLSGRIAIAEMTAAEIDLPRAPVSQPSTPSAEAPGFALPDLPVSVEIGALTVARLRLGADLLGSAAEVSLTGALSLAGGAGTTDLAVRRIDGAEGDLSLTGAFSNATGRATVDLLVSEGAGGIAADLIGLPGRPAITLALHGAGTLDDFRSDVALTTDGQPRLAGTVTLTGEGGARRFNATVGGDVAPLFLPEYRDFFGPDISLEAEGQRDPAGRLDLSRLVLRARSVALDGRLVIAATGEPVLAALTATIAAEVGGDGEEGGAATSVLLPLPGARTWIDRASLDIGYDAADSDGWRLAGALGGLRRDGMRINDVTLAGSGRVARPGQGGVAAARIGGTLTFDAGGIELDDAAAAAALGPRLAGRAIFDWRDGGPLRLPLFDVTGDGFGAAGGLTLSGLDSAGALSGRVRAGIDDIGRLSGLVGRPLGGSAALTLDGSGAVLAGRFDLDAAIEGRDLTIDVPEVDRLMAGQTRVSASVRRDSLGTRIRVLDLTAKGLTARLSGELKTGASDLSGHLDFADLSVLGPGYRGRLQAEATLRETGPSRAFTLDGQAEGLAIGQAEVDRLLAGTTELDLEARQDEAGAILLDRLRLSNPQVSAEVTGTLAEAGRRLNLSARLADLALVVPGFPGPVTVKGDMSEEAAGFGVDLTAEGPGASALALTGTVAPDFARADLAIIGSAQAGLINPFIAPRNIAGLVRFDLRLDGPPGLNSLSGRATLADGRIVAPTFGIALENTGVTADIANGSAQITAGGDVRGGRRGGGRVTASGPVSLVAPYNGDLAIRLDDVRLRQRDLYDTRLDGTVSITGPLAGGAMIRGDIALDRTEIRVPSTPIGGAAEIGPVTHLNEPAASRQTRERAGLIDDGSDDAGAGAAFGLDLAIAAPDRVFVRGRGLDAELGGTLRIGGTSDAVVPTGQFDLIRGRLDLLGRRFTIDEGQVQLQGALVPWLRFVARTRAGDTTATVTIEGEATEPEVHFTSDSGLPEEEVIALILFGRGLDNISAFQAAQLASAVATLSGRSGDGLVGRLRRSVGLDDLDVTTDETGAATLRAGKYISDRVYTDVAVGADGGSEVNLNLDLKRDITLRGTLGSDGTTGVGVFFERDY